jgi:hypothetical protein
MPNAEATAPDADLIEQIGLSVEARVPMALGATNWC